MAALVIISSLILNLILLKRILWARNLKLFENNIGQCRLIAMFVFGFMTNEILKKRKI